jgi:hypothetical protein
MYEKQRNVTLILTVCVISETASHRRPKLSAKISAQIILTALKIFLLLLEKIHYEEAKELLKKYKKKKEEERNKRTPKILILCVCSTQT